MWLALGHWKGRTYCTISPDLEDILESIKRSILRHLHERREAKIDSQRRLVYQPLNEGRLCPVYPVVGEVQRYLLGYLVRYLRWNPRHDVGLVVAALRKRRVGSGVWVLEVCAVVAKDAADVCGVEVGAVAGAAPCADAEPVVCGCLVGVDEDVVALAYSTRLISLFDIVKI
jgi:hypothetical protein